MAGEWYKDPAVVTALYDLAISNGLVRKHSTGVVDSSSVGMISVMATPSAFPEDLFALGCGIQPELNTLIDRVSLHHQFLVRALENVFKADEFTRKLFDIYEKTHHDNKQTCVLGIHRCDYMLDRQRGEESLSLKQIEMNTIASSLAGFASGVGSFHKYVSSRYAGKENPKIPENGCLGSIVDAMAAAWREYGSSEAVILFVVQDKETNVHDHRQLEFNLWQRHSIKCIRKTMTDIYQTGRLGTERELIISGVECSVVYFRSGYTPLDYPTETEWQARLLIEQSTASCCPSVAYQLIGTKKMQQCLASPGVLEQFVTDAEVLRKIHSTFAGLFSVDNTSEGDRAVDMAMREPEKYVLKPQREGGGNNFYGNEIRKKLEEIGTTSEREGFILMDRVFPPQQVGLILRPKPRCLELVPEPVVNELGIYGVYVRKGDRVLLNSSAGYCLRTKPSASNEGGLAIGVSALDSPSLTTTDQFLSAIIKQ